MSQTANYFGNFLIPNWGNEMFFSVFYVFSVRFLQ